MTNMPAPKSAASNSRRRRRKSRGQAMVEYSIINFLLICALVLGCTVGLFPGPHDRTGDLLPKIRRRNVIEMFLEAYQHYYNSYYFVLNLPFP